MAQSKCGIQVKT